MARDGITFYACRKCYENSSCDPEPEDDTTTFHRGVSVTSYGSRRVTFDEDGDIDEGSADGFDYSDGNEEDDENITCDCCAHEIYDRGNGNADDINDIVALWRDYDTDTTYTLEWAKQQGWVDDEDDDEDDVSTPITITAPVVRDDGRFVTGNVTDIAAAISAVVEDAPRDASEIQITYQS